MHGSSVYCGLMRLAACVAILGEAPLLTDKLCVPREKKAHAEKAPRAGNEQPVIARAARALTRS